jgi:hypothetical protein
MTNDAGRKPEGAPERSPKAGAGARSGVDGNGPKRFSVGGSPVGLCSGGGPNGAQGDSGPNGAQGAPGKEGGSGSSRFDPLPSDLCIAMPTDCRSEPNLPRAEALKRLYSPWPMSLRKRALGRTGGHRFSSCNPSRPNWHLATEAKPLSLRSLLGVLRTLRVGRPWLPPTRLTHKRHWPG